MEKHRTCSRAGHLFSEDFAFGSLFLLVCSSLILRPYCSRNMPDISVVALSSKLMLRSLR